MILENGRTRLLALAWALLLVSPSMKGFGIRASRIRVKDQIKSERKFCDALDSAKDRDHISCPYVDLSGCVLSKIPKDIGKFTELRILKIAATNLTELPDEIGKLRSLEVLDVSENEISDLPASMKNLKHLCCLYLRSNQLESVPSFVFEMDLYRLNLSSNGIKEISVGSKRWASKDPSAEPASGARTLVRLYLSSNEIAVLRGIQHLPNLETLILNDNFLETLPDEIGHLEKLEELNLAHNKIKLLPASIAKLKPTLKKLVLAGNPLEDRSDEGKTLGWRKLHEIFDEEVLELPEWIVEQLKLEAACSGSGSGPGSL